jgi:tetratricopeptide (TPR) repeat protein
MRHWLQALAIMATVTLCGCAGMADSMSSFLRTGPWWTAAQANTISARARELEANGELAMALDHWRRIDRITINPATARSEISRLQSKIAEAVTAHYQKGMAQLRKKKPAAARNHFLAALRLDPAFQPALIQINARFSHFPLAVHLSTSGDQPATVAKEVFGDKDKAFLVAWFNDLPVDKAMAPGTLLILPKLEKRLPKKVRKKNHPINSPKPTHCWRKMTLTAH